MTRENKIDYSRSSVFGELGRAPEGRGGGATPLYNSYRYVPPQRVGFLRSFGLKTGIHFSHFGPESSMVFEGATGVYERI